MPVHHLPYMHKHITHARASATLVCTCLCINYFVFPPTWRLAGMPTRRSPLSVNATTEGVVRWPSAFSMTLAVCRGGRQRASVFCVQYVLCAGCRMCCVRWPVLNSLGILKRAAGSEPVCVGCSVLWHGGYAPLPLLSACCSFEKGMDLVICVRHREVARTLPSITATHELVVPRSIPMTSSARREAVVLRARHCWVVQQSVGQKRHRTQLAHHMARHPSRKQAPRT